MKKIFSLIAVSVLLLFSLTLCNSGNAFKKTDENHITAPDGSEYEFLANEGFVCTFGKTTFLGKIEGEKASFIHLSMKIDTGMFSCENDPEQRILVRNVPDNEWQSYYRKSSLPKIDVSPDNCIRFELIKTVGYDVDIRHMTCNEGITGLENIKEFLADIRSQKTVNEANLYNLVKNPDGTLENCYKMGIVYGYFQGEPNLAIPLHVTSFNDKAYSIRLDAGHEYVLPEKWLSELTKSNS